MRRRDFLRGSGAFALSAGLGASLAKEVLAQLGPPPSTLACPPFTPYWGYYCDNLVNTGGFGPLKVLEIFLQGGVSPWESFYVQGGTVGRWRQFASEVGALQYYGAPASCYDDGPLAAGTETVYFADDELGQDVHLGPWIKPLWHGPGNVMSRMRVVVMNHQLLPHEVAVPFAISGKQIGRQGFCPMGTIIRRWAGAKADHAGSPRTVPASFSLVSDNSLGNPSFNVLGAVANHGGANRSVVIRYPSVWGSGDIVPKLNRPSYKTPQADQLLDVYREMYRDRLRYQYVSPSNPGFVPRARAFEAYSAGVNEILNAENLYAFLNHAPFPGPPEQLDWCVGSTGSPSLPTGDLPYAWARKRLEGAAYLLSDPAADVRHVFITDTGRHWDYDGHSTDGGLSEHHHFRTANNLWSLTSALRDLIDSGAIDLDQTVIVLKTEFGRSPFREDGGNGRAHWPYGYANVIIGGPAQQGISGAISPGGSYGEPGAGIAVAGMAYTPADVQAALLVAAGVNPFEPDGFQISEMTPPIPGGDAIDTMNKVNQHIMGLS